MSKFEIFFLLGIYFLSELMSWRAADLRYFMCLLQPHEFQWMESLGYGMIWKSAANRINLFCFHFKNEMKNCTGVFPYDVMFLRSVTAETGLVAG